MDGIWKLRFPHCMWPVKSEVCGVPNVNYPNVCTEEPCNPQSALCDGTVSLRGPREFRLHCGPSYTIFVEFLVVTKVIMFIYYLESCCISCSEVLRKVTFLYTSLDYTDTIITVHDVALVEDSLKKLRDREVNDLTESTVAMTQGKPRLVIGHRLNKQNTEYYINSPQFNAIFHIYSKLRSIPMFIFYCILHPPN